MSPGHVPSPWSTWSGLFVGRFYSCLLWLFFFDDPFVSNLVVCFLLQASFSLVDGLLANAVDHHMCKGLLPQTNHKRLSAISG